MKESTLRSTRASNHKVVPPLKSLVRPTAVVCSLALVFLLSCPELPSVSATAARDSDVSKTPAPPNLTNCERVEMQFRPSTLDFVCITQRGRALLSPAETEFLKSITIIAIHDPKTIATLAEDVTSSSYEGFVLGHSSVPYRIDYTCYDKGGRVTCFTSIGNLVEIGNLIETEDGHRFKNHGIRLRMLVPQVIPFQLRVACARNLRSLYEGLRWYLGEERSYPAPTRWYDALVHAYQVRGYTSSMAILTSAMECPGASPRQYNYAMNSDCEPNSPRDTPLLFESSPGRNQHGGAELFTFDNHDPKGGLVLLNDGTVKFIRTEEELKQLR
jgi:hypothetical protein